MLIRRWRSPRRLAVRVEGAAKFEAAHRPASRPDKTGHVVDDLRAAGR
jgi:hypothetical protein